MDDTKSKGLSYYYELEASVSFEKDYYGFLTKVEQNEATYKYSEGSYIDPDCVGDVGKTGFYNHLTCFLNHQENEFKFEKSYRFLPPSEAPLTTSEEKDNECIDEKKITVIQSGKPGKPPFRLTSDQFGFSAAEKIYKETLYNSNKYPLANLLRLSQNRGPEEQDVKKLIRRYVKNTRTIGGSFLWPVPPKEEGTRKCQYNNNRGVKSYIEDRVDLTLLEIKHALDESYDRGEHASDILYNQYWQEKTHIKEWLDHFDHSFDKYVAYFMLEPFVEDGMPINIIDGKPLDNDYIKRYKEQYKRRHLQNLTAKEICGMLERLESKILERSRNMEKVIKQYYEENHG